ncbi:ribonuclease H-like domain-containing protein [Halochromatium roseum]|uniref:ribonuclease H-like domain-containing protein n=1 Tax=Halochromatium roseum TaxID=391920 RepID=UPI0019141BD3|nr:ribonuclease H-like domain-containing protein [Halochromatium roseum]MBK5938563.1 hypothetical protein [Halochromatium roseum]
MSSLRERLRRLRASTGTQPLAPQPSARSGLAEISPDARSQEPDRDPQDQHSRDPGQPVDKAAETELLGPDATAAKARPLSLAERIRRLSTTGPKRVYERPTAEALAESLGAEIIAPGLLQLERHQPLTQRHGRFQPAHGLECHLAETNLTRLALPAPDGWTFIDTETSGLAGGTGTWAFVVGIGRIQGSEIRLRQYLLLELDAEPAMMACIQPELAAANPLISYNGKTFDLPLLETRLRLNGLPGLPESIPHLDLLYPIRRAFATRWPNCRLASCEQRLLGFERADDLPGAEAPAAWLDWLREGNPARLGAVLRHNRLDLLSLAALLPALSQVQREPLAYGADLSALARQLERSGQALEAERLLDAASRDLEPAAALALARLKRRRGAWNEAVGIWERLAAEGVINALVELAKYQEHVCGNLTLALRYARQLPMTPEHLRRCTRLQRRLERLLGAPPRPAATSSTD